jgi:hypothetical protein
MKQEVPIEYHAPMVSRGQFKSIPNLRAFPLSAAGEPSQLEANMSDVHFLLAVPLVFGVEGNAAFDNALVRYAAVAGAEESV